MPQPQYSGSFITLEGPEGAGKTTQVRLLSKQLTEMGIEHVMTRDPGGTAMGKQIRRILLHSDSTVEPMAELLLYQADRAQHVAEIIMPSLKKGMMVICDRYIDSTIAYQGYGRNIDLALIDELNQMSTGGLRPELTILFDIESADGLARLHPNGHDRLEREAIDFHRNVRKGYLALAQKEPERWAVLDAGKALSTVQEDFRRIVYERFQAKFKLDALIARTPTS